MLGGWGGGGVAFLDHCMIGLWYHMGSFSNQLSHLSFEFYIVVFCNFCILFREIYLGGKNEVTTLSRYKQAHMDLLHFPKILRNIHGDLAFTSFAIQF